jgi:hypothetical protein
MLDPNATLTLAERVADAAEQVGIPTALIGGTALAVYRYTRGTEDIDLAAYVDPFTHLGRLERVLASEGLHTRLSEPDDDDPLGGMLSVWEREDSAGEPVDIVEVVNFLNPFRPGGSPARAAILRATTLGSARLRCVTLPDLIALKLYAGGMEDLGDIVQLLALNADADLGSIRAIAGTFDSYGRLEGLIAEAEQLRGKA